MYPPDLVLFVAQLQAALHQAAWMEERFEEAEKHAHVAARLFGDLAKAGWGSHAERRGDA